MQLVLIRFFLIFLLIWFFFSFFVSPSGHYFQYQEFTAELVAKLLNAMGEDHLWLYHGEYKTEIYARDGAHISVAGSGGQYPYMFFIAAVMAWPGGWLRRSAMLIAGLALLFSASVLTVLGAYMIDVYHPVQFDLFKKYIAPTALVSLVIVLFFTWTVISGAKPDFGESPVKPL